MSDVTPLIVPADGGTVLHAFGEQVTIHLTAEQTGGRFTAFTEITPPGGGPPPHYHVEADEWFYPQEGRVEFFVNGEWTEAAVGSTVFVPAGQVHTFRNCGDTPLTMLIHLSPGGFETFFATAAAEFAKPDGPHMPTIIAAAEADGIHFVEP